MSEKEQSAGRKKPEQSQSQKLLIPDMKEELTATSKFLRLYDELPESVKESFLRTLQSKVLPKLWEQFPAKELEEDDWVGDDATSSDGDGE